MMLRSLFGGRRVLTLYPLEEAFIDPFLGKPRAMKSKDGNGLCFWVHQKYS
jgi:hypothetical protein